MLDIAPSQKRSEYSDSFNKLLNRALSRMRKSEFIGNVSLEKRKKISSTINHECIEGRDRCKRKDSELTDCRSNLNNYEESTQLLNSTKIILPKLQNRQKKIKFLGSDLSSRILRTSDKHIKTILQQIKQEGCADSSHQFKLPSKTKHRILKSECKDVPYRKENEDTNWQVEDITPWGLSSGDPIFHDYQTRTRMFD